MPRLRAVALLTAVALAATGAGALANTSHAGWPTFNGKTVINASDANRTIVGTARSDELLGGHGDDTLRGGAASDVLWGDYKPSGQNTTQHDVLDGGAGNDFLYLSHGYNRVLGGPGNDTIHAHFGRGIIDCGSGKDIVFVSRKAQKHDTIRNCETISHATLGH